jgi:hypothetical protein
MYHISLVHFDQATKHCLLTLYIRAPLSLVLSLNQAQAGPDNQTHPMNPTTTHGSVSATEFVFVYSICSKQGVRLPGAPTRSLHCARCLVYKNQLDRSQINSVVITHNVVVLGS